MKIWLDTEFLEDGRTIELISIGMVREDGRSLYLEACEFDWNRATPWLVENVRPHLDASAMMPLADIAVAVRDFAGHKPEFWAYFAAYDWVALCQLYGTMMDLPGGWPMWCRDLKQEVARLGVTDLPAQLDSEHHALADALWTRQAWEYVQARASGADVLPAVHSAHD